MSFSIVNNRVPKIFQFGQNTYFCPIKKPHHYSEVILNKLTSSRFISSFCLFRIIPARYLGNCRPHQNGEANYAEGYLKADRQDIL